MKPLTLEMIEEAMKRIITEPRRERAFMRFVSGAVYQAAQSAVADGATPSEVEQVLAGLSWAYVKGLRNGNSPVLSGQSATGAG